MSKFNSLKWLLLAIAGAYTGHIIINKLLPKIPKNIDDAGKLIQEGLQYVEDLSADVTYRVNEWGYEPNEIEQSFTNMMSLFVDFIKESSVTSNWKNNFYYTIKINEIKILANNVFNDLEKHKKIINKIYNNNKYLFKNQLNIFTPYEDIWHYININIYNNLMNMVIKLGNKTITNSEEINDKFKYQIELGENQKSGNNPVRIVSIDFDRFMNNYIEGTGLLDDNENILKKKIIKAIDENVSTVYLLEDILVKDFNLMKKEVTKNSELWNLTNHIDNFYKNTTNILLKRENEIKLRRENIKNLIKQYPKDFSKQIKWSTILSYLISDYIEEKTIFEERDSKIDIEWQDKLMNEKFKIYQTAYVFNYPDDIYIKQKAYDKNKKELPNPKNIYKNIISNAKIFQPFLDTINNNIGKILTLYKYENNQVNI